MFAEEYVSRSTLVSRVEQVWDAGLCFLWLSHHGYVSYGYTKLWQIVVNLREEANRTPQNLLNSVPCAPPAGASLRHPVPMSRLLRMADKRLYLSASRDGTVALWDVASLKPLRTLKATSASGLASWPMSAAHLPSLSSLLLGCGDRSLLAFECGSWDPKLFAPQGRCSHSQ